MNYRLNHFPNLSYWCPFCHAEYKLAVFAAKCSRHTGVTAPCGCIKTETSHLWSDLLGVAVLRYKCLVEGKCEALVQEACGG